MTQNRQEEIAKLLRQIDAPSSGHGSVTLSDMIESVHCDDTQLVVMILVDPKDGPQLEPLRQEAEKLLAHHFDDLKVSVILTAEAAQQKAPASSMPDPHGMNKNPPLDLPIKHIIAVASGKGGVGKSTVSMNLAIALAKQGYKTGLLDADIYGPSIPKMSALEGQKPDFNDDNQIIPLHAHGLKIMSIGFMVKNEEALVWRGPMVQSAIYQMFRDVEWRAEGEDELDVLIVDMPPGTGDAQLTLAQKVPVSGAIIVSTPQDIALIDARKAVAMFEKVGVPIWGVIENMSTHICSNCGHEDPIFGHGGAENEAQNLGVSFLGAIPLERSIREHADQGKPVDDHFKAIAEKIVLD